VAVMMDTEGSEIHMGDFGTGVASRKAEVGDGSPGLFLALGHACPRWGGMLASLCAAGSGPGNIHGPAGIFLIRKLGRGWERFRICPF